MEPTLSQALHLLNGDTVNAKIQQGGVIAKLLASRRSTPRSGSSTSTSAASPASRPRRSWRSSCPSSAEGTNQEQALQDVFWALLNSREFLFNH